MSRKIPSYRIIVNNAKTPNDENTTLISLLKNRNSASEPSNTKLVSVSPKNELASILGSIMNNVEPINAYFVATNLVHSR